tara:strand:- start:1483 stop:1722 length:240 start_codon:yes stop_codon:yes gene_type:complete
MPIKNDPEPERYYEWILWKMRQEKDKDTDWNKNALDYDRSEDFGLFKRSPNRDSDIVKRLNRIEEKLDILLSKNQGDLK